MGYPKPLRCWSSGALPLTFDESLSYYEVIAKCTNYINNILEELTEIQGELDNIDIEHINEVIAQAEELIEALPPEEVQTLVNDVDSLKDAVQTLGSDVDSLEGTVQTLNTAVSEKAPINHASTSTTYGVGNTSNYGHVKLTNDAKNQNSGTALSPEGGRNLENSIDKNIAYVINGNQIDRAVNEGEYVIVINSTISGITDGAYKASQSIPANTNLDSTYFTSIENIAHELNNRLPTSELLGTSRPAEPFTATFGGNTVGFLLTSGVYAEKFSLNIIFCRPNGTVLLYPISTGSSITLTPNPNGDMYSVLVETTGSGNAGVEYLRFV